MAPEFLLRDAQLTKCQFTIATRYTDTQMFYVMAGGSETSIVMVDVGARPLAPFGWSTPTVPPRRASPAQRTVKASSSTLSHQPHDSATVRQRDHYHAISARDPSPGLSTT